MIRRTAIALFLALPAAWAADEALPKAETILDRYVEVTGGQAAYEKHKTESRTGTMTLAAQGLKGSIAGFAAAPNQTYAVIELEGIGKIEQGASGDVAWDKNPMLGPRVKSGEEKAQALRESTFNEPVRWRELFVKTETVGRETIEGEDCYKVVMTPKEGKPETSYYSKKSGLVVKQEVTQVSQMGEVTVEVSVSDYKVFDGVNVPTRMGHRVPAHELI